MTRLVSIAVLLLCASAQAAPLPQPGITYYSNGSQEYLPFRQIETLPLETLKAKLEDISRHTEWLKSFDEGPLKSPGLYDDVVRETLEQAADVASALRSRKADLSACQGLEPEAAAACAGKAQRVNADLEQRARLVDEFHRSFQDR